MYLSVLSNDFSLFLPFILLDFETVPTVYRVCFYLILLRLIMKSMTNHFRDDYFSLLRQTSSYFYRCEISYLALVQDKKNHVRFTGKCMRYSLCQLSLQFSILFLFKINNSLYIHFQSLINTQILTISHIIT